MRRHDHLYLTLALAMRHHDHLYCGGLMPALPAGCAAVCTAGWGAAVPGPGGPLAATAASRGSLGPSGPSRSRGSLGPLGVGAADRGGQQEWAGGGGKDDEDGP